MKWITNEEDYSKELSGPMNSLHQGYRLNYAGTQKNIVRYVKDLRHK